MMSDFEKMPRYKIERAGFAYDALRDSHAKQGRSLEAFDELPVEDKLAWIECTDKVCSRYRGIY
jgi:hypothetical protein